MIADLSGAADRSAKSCQVSDSSVVPECLPFSTCRPSREPSPSSPTSPAVPPSGCTASVWQFPRATVCGCRLLLFPCRFHALAVAACMPGIEATLRQCEGATVRGCAGTMIRCPCHGRLIIAKVRSSFYPCALHRFPGACRRDVSAVCLFSLNGFRKKR